MIERELFRRARAPRSHVVRFVIAWGGICALGCSDESEPNDSGNEGGQSAGGSTAAGAGGKALGGSGGTAGTNTGGSSGGATGSGGEPLRPPNPRDDIGPPDGLSCLGGSRVTPVECAAGEQCCPGDIAPGAMDECVAPGSVCDNCAVDLCAAITCDGPEDCPGQLCCLRARECNDSDVCTGDWQSITCEDRCEGDGQVVCKDSRDCLTEDGVCSEFANDFVSVCF